MPPSDNIKKGFLKVFHYLIFLALFLSLFIFLAEILLRLTVPYSKYYLWLPSKETVFKPYPGIMPGVGEKALFKTNSQGVRADELANQKLRIFAVGGSTTECLYIDQKKAWPYLLQTKLSGHYKESVWVGNFGRSGLSTTGNLIELKYLLPQYKKIDLILALVGFNDFQSSLLNTYIPNSKKSDQEKIEMTFVITPLKSGGLYQQSALFRMVWKNVNRLTSLTQKPVAEDLAGSFYLGVRNARKKARQVYDSLPDLSESLLVFEDNINQMIDLAQSAKIRIIFLTQPYLWKPEMTQAEKDLLWFGFTGERSKYYSTQALTNGLILFNARLMQICKRRGVECFDLANLVERSSASFYDDVHLNEGGCREVADLILDYLIKGRK